MRRIVGSTPEYPTLTAPFHRSRRCQRAPSHAKVRPISEVDVETKATRNEPVAARPRSRLGTTEVAQILSSVSATVAPARGARGEVAAELIMLAVVLVLVRGRGWAGRHPVRPPLNHQPAKTTTTLSIRYAVY